MKDDIWGFFKNIKNNKPKNELLEIIDNQLDSRKDAEKENITRSNIINNVKLIKGGGNIIEKAFPVDCFNIERTLMTNQLSANSLLYGSYLHGIYETSKALNNILDENCSKYLNILSVKLIIDLNDKDVYIKKSKYASNVENVVKVKNYDGNEADEQFFEFKNFVLKYKKSKEWEYLSSNPSLDFENVSYISYNENTIFDLHDTIHSIKINRRMNEKNTIEIDLDNTDNLLKVQILKDNTLNNITNFNYHYEVKFAVTGENIIQQYETYAKGDEKAKSLHSLLYDEFLYNKFWHSEKNIGTLNNFSPSLYKEIYTAKGDIEYKIKCNIFSKIPTMYNYVKDILNNGDVRGEKLKKLYILLLKIDTNDSVINESISKEIDNIKKNKIETPPVVIFNIIGRFYDIYKKNFNNLILNDTKATVSNTLNSFSTIVLPGNIGWDNLINEIITKSKNEIVKKRILAIKYYNKKQKSLFARNIFNDEESTNYSFLKAKRTFGDAFTNNTNTNKTIMNENKTIINENKTNTNPNTENEIVNNAQADVNIEGTEFNLKE